MRSRKRKSDFTRHRTSRPALTFSAANLGQTNPRHCPQRNDERDTRSDPLGEPLGVREVAQLLGCSDWTVRHRLLGRGLPYVRLGNGRLVFYRKQVVDWVFQIQQEGRWLS